MKKGISLLLIITILSIAINVFATNDVSNETPITQTDANESYTVTVPATLAPGEIGVVTASGSWSSDKALFVTTDSKVAMSNGSSSFDLDVTFDGISQFGNDTALTVTEDIIIGDVPEEYTLFGVWTGTVNYTVELINTVPEGSVYYTGVTTTSLGDYDGYVSKYEFGDTLPETVSVGDVFVYGDYEYRYDKEFAYGSWVSAVAKYGWGVRVIDSTQTTYGRILNSINGIPIITLRETFTDCKNLEFLDENFVVPEQTQTMGGMFWKCTNLKKLPDGFDMPDGVTIAQSTFDLCESLECLPDNFTLSESLINANAMFDECRSLKSLPTGFYIPATLTNMGHMFAFCESLETISFEIPNTVKLLQTCFTGCTSLTGTIKINANPTDYVSCFSNTSKIIYLTGNSSILSQLAATDGYTDLGENDNVRILETAGLYETGTTNMIYSWSELVENGSLTVSNGKLSNAKNLAGDLLMPDNITSITAGAFKNCSTLTNIKVDENNTAYKSVDGVLYDKSGTTLECYPRGKSDYTEFTIPNNVNTVADYAFYYCNNLTNITIPSRVRTIGKYSFYDCYRWNNIILPEGVNSIGDYAFSGCSAFTNVSIPNSVKTIGEFAFASCYRLTSINIGSGLTSLGVRAFRDCRSLSNITVNENNTNYKSVDNVLYTKDSTSLIYYPEGKSNTSFEIPVTVISIGDAAFEMCKLESIIIPDSVTTIGKYVFANSEKLTNVNMGSGVKTINDYAFSDCTSIKNITLMDSITDIGSFVFNDCSALESVRLSSGLKSITAYTFDYCSSLSTIIIPASITMIDYRAFYNDVNVEDIDVCYMGTEEQWNAITGSYGTNPLRNSNVQYNYVP